VVSIHSPRRALSVVILLTALLVVGGGAWAGWNAIRSSTTFGPKLGGPVVVPAEFRSLIVSAAKRCPAVPVNVLAAQIAAESGWDAQATSPAGARGIAQFMPKVWRQYGIDANGDGKRSVWDPEDAITSAAELNCRNRSLVKDASGDRLRNTLAAYNAGFAAVLKYDGVPPYPETQAYVDRILTSADTVQLR